MLTFIRSGGLCIISTSLVKITGLVNFISSYRIADFVQYLPALQQITGLMDFIRPGDLCIILTSPMKITSPVDFIRS
jgi:hypothetical protein